MNELAVQTAKPAMAGQPLAKIAGRVLIWIFLITTTLVTVFPLIMMITGSLKTNAELMSGSHILPQTWQFANFKDAWEQTNFARFTWNSLFLSVVSTAGTLLVASMAAYVVNRRNFPGKKLYVGIQSSTMFVSVGAVVLRPQYDLMVKLHLNNSLWGVALILISAHATTFSF